MPKRIVICADGTWCGPEKDLQKDYPTNVLRVARAIKPIAADGVLQQVFYDWGVGSYHDALYAGITGAGVQKKSWMPTATLYRTTPPAMSYFFLVSVVELTRCGRCAV